MERATFNNNQNNVFCSGIIGVSTKTEIPRKLKKKLTEKTEPVKKTN
jgi:hypothetical protein